MERITINLDAITNRHGKTVGLVWLRFDHGYWVYGYRWCNKSIWYGLGTCRCNDHSPIVEKVVSEEFVLDVLRWRGIRLRTIADLNRYIRNCQV